ncbi:Up-regulated during septation-domain-containing protein [Crassisporium funariophilum]|nr:Up-regulated during septation-domain-containing protein [Crassisporium funariophilum]
MNGVLRLLGSATASSSPPVQQHDVIASPTVPLAFAPKTGPTWPPASSDPYPGSSESPKFTQALFVKKERPKPSPTDADYSPRQQQHNPSSSLSGFNPSRSQANFVPSSSPSRSQTFPPNSPASSSSSPRATLANRYSQRKPVIPMDPAWKRNSGNLNTRDELLMSLMASEAVIDCREYEILSAEDVEELKKEHTVLTSRLGAMTKKLALETKIRDAALSLSKINATHKKISKQTSDQLDAANARVESAQKELWKLSDRVNDVHKRLMEHRAGVLSFSVRSMEKKMSPNNQAEDSGYDSSNRSTLMSPTTSSMTGVSASSKTRFDGAHLFAGHADAVVPRAKLSAESALAEITSLEERLKAAKDALAAAGKKQAEMTRELSMIRLEKQEVETMMGLGIDELEQTLREEKLMWEEEREELLERGRQAEALQADMETKKGEVAGGAERMLAGFREMSERQLAEKEQEIQQLRHEIATLRQQMADDRAAWDQERADIEDEKMDDLTRLHDENDRLRSQSSTALTQSTSELTLGLATLQTLIKTHGIVLFSRDSSLQGLLNAIGAHVESVHKRLEGYGRAEAEWESVRRRLEDDSNISHLRTPSTPYTSFPPEESSDGTDISRITALLQPLWQILPSPEARAAKFGNNGHRSYRTGSPTPDKTANGTITSISDLDVRSLKSLYDARTGTGSGLPSSPKPGNGPFSVEAFAARVQALINDDKALIERLVRFAQAHDLLKKNAERAQKLAQDGNSALETYQKQVRILEERNMGMVARQAALQEENQLLHSTIERITAERRELESLAAEQGEECRQLTLANNTLSARTLTLAEEAAAAPEMVRKHLEAQLVEMRKRLEEAREEVEALRGGEASRGIALLDELNEMQKENGNLRAQLRAVKK